MRAQQTTVRSRPALADSSAAQILAHIQEAFRRDVVGEVLRQRQSTYPASKRAALADGITEQAIRGRGHAQAAVEAIFVSGNSNLGIGGVPDPGALDRLIRIFTLANSMEVRVTALLDLPYQVEPARAIPFLREVAVKNSKDEEAPSVAVHQLFKFATDNSSGTTPEDRSTAMAILKELYDKNLAVGGGVVTLCDIALSQKWPTVQRCRGRM